MMKRSFAALSLFAALSALAATYKVETDKPGCVYRCGETATFTVTVLDTANLCSDAAKQEVTLDNFGPKAIAKETFDIAKGSKFKVSGSLDSPGFLRLTLPRTKSEAFVFGAAFEPEKIKKGSPSPADFDEFWANARKKLAADDEAVKKLELAEDKKKAAAVAEKMCSLKGTRAGKGKAATEAARMAYDALTDAQKKYIPNNALVSLIDAEEAYEAGRVFKCGSALYKVLPSGDVTYREPVNLLSKSETVPNQVKKNGYYFLVIKISIAAFKDCRNLEELVISKSIRSIGEYALKNTPKLTKVTVLTKRLTAGKIIRAFSGSGRFKGAGITVRAPQGFVFRYEKIFKGSGGMNENARFDVIT